MPQATPELRAVWNETKAWEQIANKVTMDRGWILAKDESAMTDDDWGAIEYMIQEWDYAYGAPPDKRND